MKNEDFPSRILARRQALKISQSMLAKTVGVTTGAVQSWEHGRSTPQSFEMLRSLAAALGVTVGWLIDGGAEPEVPSIPPDILEAVKDERVQRLVRAIAKEIHGSPPQL